MVKKGDVGEAELKPRSSIGTAVLLCKDKTPSFRRKFVIDNFETLMTWVNDHIMTCFIMCLSIMEKSSRETKAEHSTTSVTAL